MSAILFDPKECLSRDIPKEMLDHWETLFYVIVDNSPLEMQGKWIFYNALLFWKPLVSRDIPLEKRHVFHNELLTNELISRIHTEIYEDVIERFPDQLIQISEELLQSVNDTINSLSVEMSRYLRSIDTFAIAKTMAIPELKEITQIDITEESKRGIKDVEEKYKKSITPILTAFREIKPKENVFSAFLKTDTLNNNQFHQMVSAGGPRTDVDDTMILKPIKNAFLRGMGDIDEYVIESLSGKKSIVYNLNEMSTTQYSNRRQQLLASIFRRIYPGDCGATITIPFLIHRDFADMVLGKNIVVYNERVTLTRKNIHKYVNSMVNMKSVMTCRHTDGYCHACGGKLAMQLPQGSMPGTIAAIEVMSIIAQLVLSTKHLIKTQSSDYLIPKELTDLFIGRFSDIFVRDTLGLDHLAIGVPYTDVERLSDLEYVEEIPTRIRHFSQIKELIIGRTSDYRPITSSVLMMDQYKSTPYFSPQFLSMIIKHPEIIKTSHDKKVIWFDLKYVDRSHPIMNVDVVNDSTKQFVRRIEELFMKKIANYTSIELVLKHLSDTIWKKTKTNILHLETLLRSSMITSSSNYDVPVVEDPNNVMFGKLSRIIPRRSIGAQLAYEQWHAFTSDPNTFIFDRPEGVFDTYLGYKE